jgi:hypothetical protein
MRREHRRLLALARELHMSEGVWAMLCILESVHGLACAERAAREWPRVAQGSAEAGR